MKTVFHPVPAKFPFSSNATCWVHCTQLCIIHQAFLYLSHPNPSSLQAHRQNAPFQAASPQCCQFRYQWHQDMALRTVPGKAGKLRTEVQPLTLLYTIFFRKGTPFVYLLLEKGTPFIYLFKKTYE